MQGVLDVVLDIVLSPALWMCVLIGLIYAILFTLWRGGGFLQLLRDAVAGILGFGLGQVFATLMHLPTVRVGEVHLLWGSLFSVLGLLVGRRYWRPRRPSKAAETARSGTSTPGAPPGAASR